MDSLSETGRSLDVTWLFCRNGEIGGRILHSRLMIKLGDGAEMNRNERPGHVMFYHVMIRKSQAQLNGFKLRAGTCFLLAERSSLIKQALQPS